MSVPIEMLRFFAEAPLADARSVSQCIALLVAGREADAAKKPSTTAAPKRPAGERSNPRSENSITTLAAAVLRAVGEPLSAARIKTELMNRFQKDVSSADSVRASLFKLARKGKVFRQDGSQFGLLEWKTSATAGDQSAVAEIDLR